MTPNGAELQVEDLRTRPELVDAIISHQLDFLQERASLVAERA